MKSGKYNVVAGFAVLTMFMLYGFLLIYLRDFHPEREAWIASYATGEHFESRLAHVHGNLFALLNIAIGLVLARLGGADGLRRWTAILGLAGLLMPLGIAAEVYLGLPPIFVIVGGVAMVAAVALAAWLTWTSWPDSVENEAI